MPGKHELYRTLHQLHQLLYKALIIIIKIIIIIIIITITITTTIIIIIISIIITVRSPELTKITNYFVISAGYSARLAFIWSFRKR